MVHNSPKSRPTREQPGPGTPGSGATHPPAPKGPGRPIILWLATILGVSTATVGLSAWIALEQPYERVDWLNLHLSLGAVAAGGLAGLLVSAAFLRATLRPLEAVRSAVGSIARGETSAEALRVDPRLGPAAAAWNQHVEQFGSLLHEKANRRAEQALASTSPSAQGLQRACDALWDGLIVLDHRLRIVYANAAAGRLLRTDGELAGRHADQVMNRGPALEAVRGAAGGSGPRRTAVEASLGVGEQESTLRFGVGRIGPQAPYGVLIVVEDITQQRAADRARDSFLASAAHELRTPLTNIRLYVERMIEDGAEDAAVRGECINVINQEARRLERIVSDTLSASEIEAGSMQIDWGEVRLDALLADLRADYEALAEEKQIALSFDLPPKLSTIRGDRDKLDMALHNLLGNALKYTPDGGAVGVQVSEQDGSVLIQVRDNGIGIAPEEHERVFDKFFRSTDARVGKITGTGLGLALAREVVRLHGGELTLESQLDRGSTFTLRVPSRADQHGGGQPRPGAAATEEAVRAKAA
jgi:signal transduction histidine kinase